MWTVEKIFTKTQKDNICTKVPFWWSDCVLNSLDFESLFWHYSVIKARLNFRLIGDNLKCFYK